MRPSTVNTARAHLVVGKERGGSLGGGKSCMLPATFAFGPSASHGGSSVPLAVLDRYSRACPPVRPTLVAAFVAVITNSVFFFFLHVHCVNPCVARCPGVFDHRGNKTIGKKNYIFFIVNFFFIVDPCVCVKCIKIGQNTIYLFILKLPRIRWKKIKIFKYVQLVKQF